MAVPLEREECQVQTTTGEARQRHAYLANLLPLTKAAMWRRAFSRKLTEIVLPEESYPL